MWHIPDDPIIACMERTGYPPWIDPDPPDIEDDPEDEEDEDERKDDNNG